MKLSLVTETFPPDVNGVANTLGRWVDAFTNRGHQVQILRPKHARDPWTMQTVAACPVPFYPEVRIGLPWPGQVIRTLKQHRPDLIHVATEGLLGFVSLLAASRLRIPIVSSFHTHFDRYCEHYGMGWIRSLGLHYLRWFHNRTRSTLAPSRATCKQLIEAGFKRVALWSRGIDDQCFHPNKRSYELRHTWGAGEHECVILYVGRLAQEKNLTLLVNAYQQLRSRPKQESFNAVLVLVGDGPMRPWLEQQQNTGVLVTGILRGEALAQAYASADLFAFPSRTETFGNVILEAQASGLAVLAMNDATMCERIQHQSTGWLAKNDQDFREAMWHLIIQPNLRRELGHKARLAAETQSWQPIFDQLEQYYLDIIFNFHKGKYAARLNLL